MRDSSQQHAVTWHSLLWVCVLLASFLPWQRGSALGQGDPIFADGFEAPTLPPCPSDGDGDGLIDLRCVEAFEPVEPADIASPIDPTLPRRFPDIVRFIWEPGAVQRGLNPGQLEVHRVSVLRGRVLDGLGNPLAGALVRVLDHPEVGYTWSRADGHYDLVVNGGGDLVVDFRREGYLSAQRTVLTGWWQQHSVSDIAMVSLDTAVTAVALGPSSPGVLARGSLIDDSDGARQASVYFPPGVSAELVGWSGTRQPVEQINFRATEYTVGPMGPRRMPGELPETSAYTYAVELSADEAIAADARHVEFSEPVVLYVENFMGFEVGGPVPIGWYDRRQGSWIPSTDGRVVEVLFVSGGLAILDVDGSGKPASNEQLIELGIRDDERERLAQLYASGTTLWRSPIPHFTPWDCNWPFLPPPDAEPPPALEPEPSSDPDGNDDDNPDLPDPDDPPCPGGGPCDPDNNDSTEADPTDSDPQVDKPNCEEGSIIECENRVLKEVIPVIGTGHQLVYSSARVPDAQRRLEDADFEIRVPITGGTVPASLLRASVVLQYAGRRVETQFASPAPNLIHAVRIPFIDVYGRNALNGRLDYCADVSFVYRSVPAGAPPPTPGGLQELLDRLFATATGFQISAARWRGEVSYTRRMCSSVSARTTRRTPATNYLWDARGLKLGGWTIADHHAYDLQLGSLIMGDGTTRSTLLVDGVAGNGADLLLPLDAPELVDSAPLRVGPDGSLYSIRSGPDNLTQQVIRFSPGSTSATVIAEVCLSDAQWRGSCPGNIFGGGVFALTVFDNGRVAFSTDRAIYRQNASGAFEMVLDGQNIARLCIPVSLATHRRDLYVGCVDGEATQWIARLSAEASLTPVAGFGSSTAEGASALDSQVSVRELAVDRDGNVLFAEASRVRRIGTDGLVRTVAGTGVVGDSGEAIPAGSAQLGTIWSVAAARDGYLYIADSSRDGRIREVRDTGQMYTTAGGRPGGVPPPSGNSAELARAIRFDGTDIKIAIAPDGSLLLKRGSSLAVLPRSMFYRYLDLFGGASNARIRVPASDGREVYIFDDRGRHLETRHALTGDVLNQFEYTQDGLLIRVIDGDGDATEIERGADGQATAIVGPDGQRTGLTIDSRGWLTQVRDPMLATWKMQYANGGHLLRFENRVGDATVFTYDLAGELESERNEEGAGWDIEFNRYRNNESRAVRMTSALGTREQVYIVDDAPNGIRQRLNTHASGSVTRSAVNLSGTTVTERQAGIASVRSTRTQRPDPRFGFDAPFAGAINLEHRAFSYGSNTLEAIIARQATASSAGVVAPFNLEEQITINGRTSTSVFDAATRRQEYVSAAGRSSTVYLGTNGRWTRFEVAARHPLEISYDARGRVTTLTEGSGLTQRRQQLIYGSLGYVDQVTDAEQHVTNFLRDNNGRVQAVVLPDERVAEIIYDAEGRIRQLSPPGRPAHSFGYDRAGRLSEYSPPSVSAFDPATRYIWNADNRLIRVERPGERVVALSWAQRLESMTTAEGQWSWEWDGDWPLRIDAPGNVQLRYEWQGNLMRAQEWQGAVSGRVEYDYDTNRWLTRLRVNGNEADYRYDDDGLTIGVGPMTLVRDAANGSLLGTTLGQVSDTWSYSAFGEPEAYEARVAGETLYRVEFARDRLGRITEKHETVSNAATVFNYTYDLAGRLSQVHQDGILISEYTFDSNSNRIGWQRNGVADDCLPDGNVVGTYDVQDRMLSYGRCTFTYTDAGELRTKTRTDTSAVTNYSYDDFGNLRRVELPNGDLVEYLIDGRNRRVGKKVNGIVVQRLLYMNQLEPVAELDGSGNLIARFIYGDRPHVPGYIIKGGVTYRVIADHLGSVRFVINQTNGSIAQELIFDEYGRVMTDTNPGFQPFGFVGGLLDADTGLTRFGARDYQPSAGSWTTKDRKKNFSRNQNLYSYCAANPVFCRDIDGRDLWLWQCSPASIPFARNRAESPTFDTLAHGNRTNEYIAVCRDKNVWTDIEWMSDEKFIAEISSHPEYTPTVHINLFICHSASGENPLARRVHEALGNPVTGFVGEGSISSDGSYSDNRRTFPEE